MLFSNVLEKPHFLKINLVAVFKVKSTSNEEKGFKKLKKFLFFFLTKKDEKYLMAIGYF